jgi:hypothetical protein
MASRQRASFDKVQRERARREKQAAKRARRQGKPMPGESIPFPQEDRAPDPEVQDGEGAGGEGPVETVQDVSP